MDQIIEGIQVSPLKIIPGEKGTILHVLKRSDSHFVDFGEAYFTSVFKGKIKGWKKHIKMTLNLVVPIGKVKFVFFDDRINSKTYNHFYEIILSSENYCRLMVNPGIWMAFQGLDDDPNIVLNIANIEHNPDDTYDKDLDQIDYKW